MNTTPILNILLPLFENVVKEALDYDFETAKGVLLGYLGTSNENLIRIELAITEAKKQKLLSEIK